MHKNTTMSSKSSIVEKDKYWESQDYYNPCYRSRFKVKKNTNTKDTKNIESDTEIIKSIKDVDNRSKNTNKR